MADRVSRRGKRKTAILRHVCVDHCILLLQHLSTQMHFITNGYKRFSKTNSFDPRQRVPLSRAMKLARYFSKRLHITVDYQITSPLYSIIIYSNARPKCIRPDWFFLYLTMNTKRHPPIYATMSTHLSRKATLNLSQGLTEERSLQNLRMPRPYTTTSSALFSSHASPQCILGADSMKGSIIMEYGNTKVCCVTNACKRTQCTYRKEKGFASVLLVWLAAYCATALCKPLHGAMEKE